MAFARWSKSSTSTWIFGGAVQLFSGFSCSGAFLANGDLSGEGSLWRFFFLVRGRGIFGGGRFIFLGGGSPLFGENKAFITDPSDRPAINNATPKLKG